MKPAPIVDEVIEEATLEQIEEATTNE